MSGIDIQEADGKRSLRKGALKSVETLVKQHGYQLPEEVRRCPPDR